MEITLASKLLQNLSCPCLFFAARRHEQVLQVRRRELLLHWREAGSKWQLTSHGR